MFSFRSTLVALPLIAASILGGQAFAQSAPPTCDVSSLKGTYAIHFSGTVYDQDYYTYLLREIGFITFDGAGNFTGTDTYNFDGTVTRRKLSGTYALNSDCTGSIVINGSDKTVANGDLAVALTTKEVNFTQTDNLWVFSGTMKFQY